MIDFELTEEQRQVRELCRQFADAELRPNARKWDVDHQFPAEAVKKLGLNRGRSPLRRDLFQPPVIPRGDSRQMTLL